METNAISNDTDTGTDDVPVRSAKEQSKQVQDFVNSVAAKPDGCEFFVRAIRNAPLNQGLICDLSIELISKLNARSRTELESAGFLNGPSKRDKWSELVVWAFVVVLIGSFLGLAFRAVYPIEGGETGAQILLTIFTTSVGFLSGLLFPGPSAGPSSPTPTRVRSVRGSQSEESSDSEDG